ncbi:MULTISPECIES: TRAP transporter permease [unclassified Sedimentibacter]|uniref:TRAP transporter permease n=1 Tax=unclassified Sedimentibacter TaxID=2649220 RepID=UPI0027E10203|nr:TRAP transporter permease [Sedimentibacter sp. MB35-C1]WMJ78755.1 TRAP transporter permease [Sedimentibacter sp. MB35-C1]
MTEKIGNDIVKDIDEEVSQEEVDQILRKYDKGSDFRVLSGNANKIISMMLLGFSLFQLYTAIFLGMEPMILRSIHLAFGLSLIFLLYPASKKWPKDKLHPMDIITAVVVVIVCFYVVVFYKDLVYRAGRITDTDMIIGLMAVFLVLEAARRVIGLPMVIISVLFIIYAFLGPYIPGKLAHRGVSLNNFAQHIFFTTEGIMGLPIGVSSTFIFMFLLFGAYLEKTGMGEFFINLANSVSGSSPGGPAKVAVISSGCMGTLSGSSVANVVGTGSFTIPMMKRLGYRNEFSGAVEATASTGGQLMPPIMGAAAFLMAEITNTPYFTIIKAAAIPALLYYFGVWAGVHFEAKKLNLMGLPKDQIPKIGHVMKTRGHLIIPIIVVMYLLIQGFSPIRAALGAIVSTLICSSFTKDTRMSFKDIVEGLIKGAKSALTVVAACACAGIIIGVVTQTGLGLKMGSVIVGLAKGNLFMTLFFTMITSLILGIGVPTTANYVITSTIAAPALLLLGVDVIPAHMFVFYFGIIADVTPPVCLAAVAASGIAKSEPMSTGVQATRLAIAAFLIPYIFVHSPRLLMINTTPLLLIFDIATALVGITCIAIALTGFFKTRMSIIEKVLFAAGGLFLVLTKVHFVAIGIVLIALVYMLQKRKEQKISKSTT